MPKLSTSHDVEKQLNSEELVKEYLPLVRSIAKRYSRMNPDNVDDLFQVGCLGLLKAVKYYDAQREGRASFKTFASLYIRGEIKHYLRDHGSLIQMPRRLNEISGKLSQLEEVLSREMGHTPTVQELARRSGYTPEDVREARQSWDNCRHYESFESAEENESSEESRCLSELIADRKYLDELNNSEDREIISQALVSLGESTKKIIEFVYFYDLTQKETANLLGLSEMGVSRSVRKALVKLKEVLLTEIF